MGNMPLIDIRRNFNVVLLQFPLIVGGTSAAVGSWPWQVALRETSSGEVICGGSLIGDRLILTAASCVNK